MKRRSLGVLATLAALWLAVACLDVSSPVPGIAAVTAVLPPTPSVVIGDNSRDTSGVVQPLRVIAFGPNGDTLKPEDVVVRFFAVDTSNGLQVNSETGLAFGASLSPLARVVAQVSPVDGNGVIQTVPVALPVVPKPVSAKRSDDTTFIFDVPSAATDTFAAVLLSPPLSVTVYGATTDTVIPSYVVSYEIVREPRSKNGEHTVVLFDRSGNDSTIAVTSASGVASRQLRIRTGAIDPSLFSGATDTAVVRVRVRYRDELLPVTPSDSFVIAIRIKGS